MRDLGCEVSVVRVNEDGTGEAAYEHLRTGPASKTPRLRNHGILIRDLSMRPISIEMRVIVIIIIIIQIFTYSFKQPTT